MLVVSMQVSWGNAVPVDICPHDTVGTLQAKVEEVTGIHCKQCDLLFHGRRIVPTADALLSDLGIKNEVTLSFGSVGVAEAGKGSAADAAFGDVCILHRCLRRIHRFSPGVEGRELRRDGGRCISLGHWSLIASGKADASTLPPSSLHAACSAGRADAIESLVTHNGFFTNRRDVGGWTPLHTAMSGRDEASVICLLTLGAKDVATDDGVRASFLCPKLWNRVAGEEAALLPTAAWNPPGTAEQAVTQLVAMIAEEHISAEAVCRYVCDAVHMLGTAVLQELDTETRWIESWLAKWTILLAAAGTGRYSLCRLCVALDADVDKAVSDGVAPLHVACLNNRRHITALFLEWSADPAKADRDGDTPVAWARSLGQCDDQLEEALELATRDRAAAIERLRALSPSAPQTCPILPLCMRDECRDLDEVSPDRKWKVSLHQLCRAVSETSDPAGLVTLRSVVGHWCRIMTASCGGKAEEELGVFRPIVRLVQDTFKHDPLQAWYLPGAPCDTDRCAALEVARGSRDFTPHEWMCQRCGASFLIGQCGHPMEVGRCTCGSVIGGQSHTHNANSVRLRERREPVVDCGWVPNEGVPPPLPLPQNDGEQVPREHCCFEAASMQLRGAVNGHLPYHMERSHPPIVSRIVSMVLDLSLVASLVAEPPAETPSLIRRLVEAQQASPSKWDAAMAHSLGPLHYLQHSLASHWAALQQLLHPRSEAKVGAFLHGVLFCLHQKSADGPSEDWTTAEARNEWERWMASEVIQPVAAGFDRGD